MGFVKKLFKRRNGNKKEKEPEPAALSFEEEHPFSDNEYEDEEQQVVQERSLSMEDSPRNGSSEEKSHISGAIAPALSAAESSVASPVYSPADPLAETPTSSAEMEDAPEDEEDNLEVSSTEIMRKTVYHHHGPPGSASQSLGASARPSERRPILDGRRGMDPPPVREAAFHGPPRFDWIDIELAAATKIQSIYRRNKVMDELTKQGFSTSAMRNRNRRRKARTVGLGLSSKNSFHRNQSADTPSLFSCCFVGLAFGDATEDDEEAYREFQRRQYEARVQQQAMHEEALRIRYLKSNMRTPQVVEALEVIDEPGQF